MIKHIGHKQYKRLSGKRNFKHRSRGILQARLDSEVKEYEDSSIIKTEFGISGRKYQMALYCR